MGGLKPTHLDVQSFVRNRDKGKRAAGLAAGVGGLDEPSDRHIGNSLDLGGTGPVKMGRQHGSDPTCALEGSPNLGPVAHRREVGVLLEVPVSAKRRLVERVVATYPARR